MAKNTVHDAVGEASNKSEQPSSASSAEPSWAASELPRGIYQIRKRGGKNRLRVTVQRQKRVYHGGEYATLEEAKEALADLHRALKDVPKGKRKRAGTERHQRFKKAGIECTADFPLLYRYQYTTT